MTDAQAVAKALVESHGIAWQEESAFHRGIVKALEDQRQQVWEKAANHFKKKYEFKEKHQGRPSKTWGSGVMSGHISADRNAEIWCRQQAQGKGGKWMSDPLKPSLSLLVKLGSAIVHIEEFFSPSGHEFDKHALDTLLADKEVRAWVKQMGSFLPVKR